MAWNESGGDDKDPWGNRGNQGPPDLDEAIRKLQSQLSGLFGGKGSSDGGVKGPSQGMIWLGVILAAVAYVISGIYQIDEQERGVVFRFGEVQPDLKTAGLHWYPLSLIHI